MTSIGTPTAAATDPCGTVVLLPIYNGAHYLAAQLDSILVQTERRVLILCRDDGSKDDSPAILQHYAALHPLQVRVLQDDLGNLGARGNFSRLMEAALAPDLWPQQAPAATYYALSDQDDVWHTNKLARLISAMRELEQDAPQAPALVHSDLRVVDETGLTIAPSMAAYQGLRPDRDRFAAQLMSNTVTGCTALLNRALLARSTPVPPESIMHDWWISLVASAFGRRAYLQEALVDYRQHANNTIGAKEWIKPVARRHFIARILDDRHHEVFMANAAQARAFARHFDKQIGLYQRLALVLARGLAVHYAPFQRVMFRLLRLL